MDAEKLYEDGRSSGTRERLRAQRGGVQRACGSLLRGAWLRGDCDGLPPRCPLLLSPLGRGWQGSTTRAALSADRRPTKSIADATATIQTPVEHLDLATVIKVSEAVSGEIVLEKLIDTLMRTAIEHAGAERGLLILPRGEDYRIEAEVTTSSDHVNVVLRQASVSAAALPGSVFQYVLRTKERVLLQDAAGQNIFAADEYIREHRPRSVLCLPLLKQARLLGVLYLENRLTPHAFTPARMAVLKLLASGAAMSMENTHLYSDLQEREARITRAQGSALS